MTDTEAPLLPLPEPTAFLLCRGSDVSARAWNVDQIREYARACVLADRAARVAQQQDAEEIRWRCLEVIALGCSGNPSKDATDALVESGFWNTAQGDSVVPPVQPETVDLPTSHAPVLMPAQVDIKALAKRAKLPKYMYDTEGGRDALSRLVAIATQPSRVQPLVEQLAQQWDGCMWDGPGGDIDIGEAIRDAGRRLFGDSVVPTPQPSGGRHA